MSDEPEAKTAAFSVYWRARDGAGTRTWKTGLTEAEANAQVAWCEGAHPEATLVWATQDV